MSPAAGDRKLVRHLKSQTAKKGTRGNDTFQSPNFVNSSIPVAGLVGKREDLLRLSASVLLGALNALNFNAASASANC